VFKKANVSRQASYDWVTLNAGEFMEKAMNAAGAMIQRHADEQAAKKTGG
jgi:hypothetical protein